jgi:hypothetical protein
MPTAEAIDEYAHAVAALRGIRVAEEWWPGVGRHLELLLSSARALEEWSASREHSAAEDAR